MADTIAGFFIGVVLVFTIAVYTKVSAIEDKLDEIRVERNEWGQRTDTLPEHMCKGTILMWTEACADFRL